MEDRQKESSRWTRPHWQTPLTRILVKKDSDDGYNDGDDGDDDGEDHNTHHWVKKHKNLCPLGKLAMLWRTG